MTITLHKGRGKTNIGLKGAERCDMTNILNVFFSCFEEEIKMNTAHGQLDLTATATQYIELLSHRHKFVYLRELIHIRSLAQTTSVVTC